jgi:MFS family permease
MLGAVRFLAHSPLMPAAPAPATPMPPPHRLILVLGGNQIISWGITFYLPAVIAGSAAISLGTSRVAVVGGFSWALLVAGAVAPRIGRRIDRDGGRRILAASTFIIATGLALLGAAPDLTLWYLGWTVLGIGMAAGLYDAAFATVGCLLGSEAAAVITGITLIAGFASTVFWSLGAFLAAAIGWRSLLFCYAGLEVAVNLPLVLLFVPQRRPAPPSSTTPAAARVPVPARVKSLACLSSYFTIRWLITSAVAVYILPLLSGIGLSRAHAVFVAAMIGPGQVAGRIVEWMLARRIGLLSRARLGALLLPVGAGLLLLGGPKAAAAFAILYGMSNGILTINRGTLPMAIFGPTGYATLLGWLAVPVLLAQAAAPTLAAPVVAALPALQFFLLAGALGGGAGLLLLPLRVGDALPARLRDR